MRNVEIERGLCDLGASVSIIPYSLFHKLHLGPLLVTPFSLQLADSSVMQPIGKMDNVPVDIGDIWVLDDFIIVDMPETDDAQIILRRPILGTTCCHIDVKEGRISFEVEGHFAVFSHRKEDVVSPHSSILDALLLSPKIDMEDVLNYKDPPDSNLISYEDPDQGHVKVKFATPMPPKKPEVQVPIPNESSMSEYCRFAQIVLSMPPKEGLMPILK